MVLKNFHYYLQNEIDAINAVRNCPTGFPNRTDTSLSFVAATRTLSITPTGLSFVIWQNGLPYTISGTGSITIPDTSGQHVIYYDGTTLSRILNPTIAQYDDLMLNKVLAAIIYWNATDGVANLLADDRHGCVMSGETHEYLHDGFGALYREGFGISGYMLSTASDAALTFEIVNGKFEDEDILVEIEDGNPAVKYEQQLNGGDASLPVLYRDDIDGSWTEQAASTLPYISAVAGNNRLAYQNDDGDGTWSQVEVGNNKFVLFSVVATNDWQYPIKMVQGSEEYLTQALASAGFETEIIAWGDFPSVELILMYVFIMQTSNGFGGTKKAKIIDVIDFRAAKITGASAVTQDHGSLSGLDDVDDHAGYVTLDGLRALTGNWNVGAFNITAQTLIGANVTSGVDPGHTHSAGGGKVAQVVVDTYTTVATHGTGFPNDDTIPQDDEGDQILTSGAFTPINAGSTILIFYTTNTRNTVLMNAVGLFSSLSSDVLQFAGYAYNVVQTSSIYSESAGSTNSRVYTIRIGDSTGNDITTNDNPLAKFGATEKCQLIVMEVLP